MASANPAMSDSVYHRAGYAAPGQVMTIGGTAAKTAVLVLLLLITGGFAWAQAAEGPTPIAVGLLIGGTLGGFIVALVTIFLPNLAPFTAPLYAALEGLALGTISAFAETRYPGIVTQAVGLSIGVLAVMLFVYGTGLIRATEKFTIGLIAATGAICLVYVADMVLSLFTSTRVPFIHESGPIGIGFSVVVVIIAALNLILDFDFIERGAAQQAPKRMEWYGGFSLLVTLVWMYLEILRLLSKLRRE